LPVVVVVVVVVAILVMYTYKVALAKERHKFSASHFTLFPPATVERLHGHNYQVTVELEATVLADGMMAPFHTVKEAIELVCAGWDERVFLPTQSPYVALQKVEQQLEVRLTMGQAIGKFYSMPVEDVVLLECDNVTCENLARLFLLQLVERLDTSTLLRITVAIDEGGSQSVSCSLDCKIIK